MDPHVHMFVCTVGEDADLELTVFLQHVSDPPKLSVEVLMTPDEADALASELIIAASSARRKEMYSTKCPTPPPGVGG